MIQSTILRRGLLVISSPLIVPLLAADYATDRRRRVAGFWATLAALWRGEIDPVVIVRRSEYLAALATRASDGGRR